MECIIHREVAKAVRTSPRKRIKSTIYESKLLSLTNAVWDNILTVAHVRKKLPHYAKSVYHDIIEKLPEKFPSNRGYHIECYRSFTSLPKQTVKSLSFDDSDVTPSTSTSHHTLRSVNVHGIGSSTSSGVLEKKCIFCKREHKKVKGKWQPLTQCTLDSAEDFIKSVIKQRGDDELNTLVGDISFHAKEVHYHKKCLQDYVDEAKKLEKEKGSSEIEDAYSELYDDVEALILGNRQPMTAKSLLEKFRPICEKNGLQVPEQRTVLQHTLEHFKDRLKVLIESKKGGNILYDATIEPDLVPLLLRGAMNIHDDDSLLLKKAAPVLCQMLLNVKNTCTALSTSLTSQNFKNGQAEVPQQCIEFFVMFFLLIQRSPLRRRLG